jgi:putative exosortase-associated protein (TIGR04073 family)
MRRFLISTLAIVLVVGMGCWSFAYETDFDDLQNFDRSLPAWKFGRGIVNMISGPHEVAAHASNAAINGAYNGAYESGFYGQFAGGLNGLIAGTFTGLVAGVRRTALGVLEVATFWKPEYGPTMDPEYGTRCRAFGDQDYFDPDPFWYTGPPR